MVRKLLLLSLVFSWSYSFVSAQTPISKYEFDGDLTNLSAFVDKNGTPAPDGTFREGGLSSTAVVGVPTFGLGVDGTPNGAIRLDGIDDWLDITVNGHPGETVQQGSASGPGLVSGTVMAWVKTDHAASAQSRWLMGNSNANDFQSWRVGWSGAQLEAVAQAADGPGSQFTVSDSTNDTSWADGEWHHLAVKWDGFPSVDEAKIFVDGVPLGLASSGSSLTSANTQSSWQFPMAIGARNNAGVLEGFWDGLIDDLRVYAESVSDAFILSEFNAVDIAQVPDFNSDNRVDGADFFAWQLGFGTGNSFADGDANNSGTVDEVDLAIWEGSYGELSLAPPATAVVAAVPEPSTLVLLWSVALAAIGRRGRRG